MGPDVRRGLVLALLGLAVYNANLREVSSQDTIPTRLLPVALIRDGRLDLDRYFRDRPPDAPLPYWVQRVNGHYRSTYPVLPALVAVPVYLGPVLLLGGDSWALVNVLAKLSASLLAALSVLVVHLAVCRLAPPGPAVGVTLIYAFATPVWSTASQGLWGHAPALLCLSIALHAALRAETDPRATHIIGVAAGLMVAARPPTGFLGAALVLHVLHRHRWRGAGCLTAFCLVTGAFLASNLWLFGSLQGGYARLTEWSTPLVGGLTGLFLSPSRGLLVYSPVLAFALVGLALGCRGPHGRLFRWLALGFGACAVLLARFWIWWGGHSFGPRYFTDFLPLFALALAPVWGHLAASASLRGTMLALATLSVFVQAVGAFYHPSPRAVDWNTSPADVDDAPHRLWDWHDSQILRLLTNGPHPPGFTEWESP